MRTCFQISLLIFFNYFGLCDYLFSQVDRTENIVEEISIKEVSIEGIDKNDEQYLYNFIKTEKGDVVNLDLLEQDAQQLSRRTGIAQTTFKIDTLSETSANIRFIIKEQKTLLPQLGIGGIKNNFWWTVGLAEYNLLGREQVLLGYFLQNDGRANFKVYYENKRFKARNWGYAFDINHTSSIEPLYFPESTVFYIYSNSGAGMMGIKHFGFSHRLTFGGNYFRETYSKEKQTSPDNTEGPDFLRLNKLLLKSDFIIDKIKYNYFYRKGHFYNLKLQYVLTLEDESSFTSLSFEGRKYWRLNEKGNIALRLRAALATNRDSPFAPFVLDSRVNIRGVGNRVDRGTAQFVINLEYRHTVFHNNQWAAQVVGFSDWGTWRNPGGDLKELWEQDQFRHFVGGGARLINKKVLSFILRLDYGFDLWNPNQQGFVFGVDQYF